MNEREVVGSAGNSKGVSRRTLGMASAWAVPALVLAAPAPAFAASMLKFGDYVALQDTQGTITIKEGTNGDTWPHGLLTQGNSDDTFVFQLGMQLDIWNGVIYNTVPNDTYKNWFSGPITVTIDINTTYLLLETSFTNWTDAADNGGAPWVYAGQSTVGTWTSLTFTHPQIAMSGNTLGIPTQTGAFEFVVKKTPDFTELLVQPTKTLDPPQGTEGRSATTAMRITVSSGLGTDYKSYVQENATGM